MKDLDGSIHFVVQKSVRCMVEVKDFAWVCFASLETKLFVRQSKQNFEILLCCLRVRKERLSVHEGEKEQYRIGVNKISTVLLTARLIPCVSEETHRSLNFGRNRMSARNLELRYAFVAPSPLRQVCLEPFLIDVKRERRAQLSSWCSLERLNA